MRPIRKKHSLQFEPLEPRRVLATITVTTVDDVVDIPDTPSLADLPGPDGVVSLREALLVANEIEGSDTVEFDLATSPGVIQVTDGNLISYGPLRISGPGPSELTIDLNGNEMHFIPTHPTYFRSVDISGLEIVNGHRALRAQQFLVSIVDSVFRDNDVAMGSFDETITESSMVQLTIIRSIFENNRGVVGGFSESRSPLRANFDIAISDSALINTEMSVDFLNHDDTLIRNSRLGGATVRAFSATGRFGHFTRVEKLRGIGRRLLMQY